MVFVAFALEDAQHKLVIQITDPKELDKFKRDVLSLHQKGIKVILSTGGESGPYPWDDTTLSDSQVAKQYIEFLNQYNLDGLDFDVEAGGGERIPTILKLIKQQKSDLFVSLTVSSEPGDSIPPVFQSLGAALYKSGSLNYLNLMNYDQNWVQPGCTYEDINPANNCYIQNVLKTTELLKKWTGDDTKAKQLLSNGILIGYGDDKKIVTPDLTKMLTIWLKQNNYGAVMTWGLSRDQSSLEEGKNLANTTGMLNLPSLIYTKTILAALK